MSTLLNLSGMIEPQTVEVLENVDRIIAGLGMPYVIVGATARDLVLHYGYSAALQRATRDVDFAIEVPDWHAFDTLRNRLAEQGFRRTSAQHRLISPSDVVVDIIPFGRLEDELAFIAWPPKGEVVMNVLGFQEAYDNAEWVRIQESPELDVPVVTPRGMMLLKLIAWADRARDIRVKDAQDIAYLLASYEVIPAVRDELYEHEQIMELYGWDQTLGCAHMLGKHARKIAGKNTSAMISRLTNGELDGRSRERLIDEMCTPHVKSQYEQNRRLLSAFLAGFGVGV
ncbi:MAG: nucleotidyl transferase AbiEii/AbiGii toxin family protein [Candidatus Sedimenticola sp. (ex Thyasira tokunagai)]